MQVLVAHYAEWIYGEEKKRERAYARRERGKVRKNTKGKAG